MGKSKKPKVEVTEYYMSQHFGVCLGADAALRVIIKEKTAWEGEWTGLTTTLIQEDNLFGGATKEGGATGTIYWLPGASDQVLPDILAQKLGRADGADAPGYRGLASIWFTGRPDVNDGALGFYWSANSPYLPGVWVTVRRAPVGLNPAYAFCGASASPSAAICICIEKQSTMNSGTRMATARQGVIGYLEYLQGLVAAGRVVDLQVRSVFSTTLSQTYRSATVEDIDDAIAWIETVNTGPTIIGDWRPAANGLKLFFDGTDGAVTDRQIVWVGYGEAGWHFMAVGAATTINGLVPLPSIKVVQIDNSDESDAELIHNNPAGTIPHLDDGDSEGVTDAMIDAVAEATGLRRDANPAHIIFECLTNTDWGMGSPETAIDKAGFEAVAVALYNENFCLSLIWTRQASIQDFIQEVLDHIQAVLFVDPATGLMTLSLIRGDYDEANLPVIDPDNAELSNFARKLWGDITNEIAVTWTNPENEQDETVTVQDLASIVTQGGIVSDSRNYYGVRNASLAARLAQRDLRSAGAPLATCEAEVDRTLWDIRPASVVKVTWPEYGLVEVIFRVTSVDYGRPGDPAIKLSLVEDVFGLDAGAYVEPPSTGWVDPSEAPLPLTIEQLFTMPLFFAANSEVADFADSPEYPEVVAGILATTDQSDAYGYDLWDEVTLSNGDLEWQEIATGRNLIGHAELVGALPAEASSTGVTFDNLLGGRGPTLAGFAIIGDEGEAGNEIAQVDAVGASYTLRRGVLDTVPRAWPAATPVWFLDDGTLFEDPTIRAAGETVDVKLLTRTSLGVLALADAALVSAEMSERPWLPNRPADVTAYDGTAFSSLDAPIDATDRADPWVTIDWANRNRLLEDSQVLSWTDATVTPETGQTTKITVLETDGVTVLATHDGLSGTTFDVPDASFGTASVVIIRTSAERSDADGDFESLQSFDHYVIVGASFRSTEDGDRRVTEDGDTRIQED